MRLHQSSSIFDEEKIAVLELRLEQVSSQLEMENKLLEPVWVLGHSKSGKAQNLDFTSLIENKKTRQFWVDNFDLNIEYFVKESILTDATKSKLNQKHTIGKMLRRNLRNIHLVLNYVEESYSKKRPESNVAVISRHDFDQFIYFLLVNDWKNGEVTPRSKPISYNTYQRRLQLESWKNFLRSKFITNLIDLDLSNMDERQALRKAFKLIKANDQTFADWKSGSSLNSLTLDLGQYYVEHCLKVFNSNSPIVTAMLRAIEDRIDIGMKLNCSIKFASSPRWKTICEQLICGLTPKESMLNGYKNLDLTIAHNLLNESYASHCKSLMASSSLTSKENTGFIANKLGIDNITENRDALSIFIDLFEDKKLEGLEHIVASRFSKITLKKLESAIEFEKLKIIRTIDFDLPTLQQWKSAGFDLETSHSQRRKTLNQLVDSTIAAGTVACLAFTGWRASEFSFSMSDITLEANKDVLDQEAFPFRIHVNSLVPKTHGYQLKQKREITYPIYKLLKNISLITTGKQSEPIFQTSKAGSFTSSKLYYNSSYLWTHFANFYPPFREFDELVKRKDLALEKEDINFDAMMFRAYTQIRNELPRVSLFLSRFERRTDLRYGKNSLLWEYKNSGLSAEKMKIFDCILKRETKERIYRLQDSKLIDIELTSVIPPIIN